MWEGVDKNDWVESSKVQKKSQNQIDKELQRDAKKLMQDAKQNSSVLDEEKMSLISSQFTVSKTKT